MWMLAALAAGALVAWTLRSRAVSLPSLDRRWVPAAVGITWALLAWLAWGTTHPIPLFHDEASYLLQARLIASGRWSAAPPPSPEFFAQPHVLTEPVLTSKYPPGHALLLAVGQLIGLPVLVVVILNALRTSLVFALARRFAGGWTALLTVVLLAASPGQRRWSASFFSEVTSGACLMLAWWALLRWRANRSAAWLLLVATALGWCAITRPWSAIAFAIPIGVIVLRDVAKTRNWRQLTLAVAAGALVVSIIPLWAYETTGSWHDIPLARYARDYMPYDYPHFGVSDAVPRREQSADVAAIGASLREVERAHTIAHLAGDAFQRLRFWIGDLWPTWMVLFVVLFLIGARMAPAEARTGLVTLALVFVAYLAHPTWPQWTLYYFEVAPVALFAVALGITAVAAWIVGTGSSAREGNARRLAAVPAVVSLVLLPGLLSSAIAMRAALDAAMQPARRFAAQVAQLPETRSIVFVRFGPFHSPHDVVLLGDPDWMTAKSWVVIDRGLDDARLAALAPDRQPYVYDQATGQFVRIAQRPAVTR